MPKSTKKQNLPKKTCKTCGLPFSWRKKWEKNWEHLTYLAKNADETKRNRLGLVYQQFKG